MNDELYGKALFQFRGAVLEALNPLRKYGQQDYVVEVVPVLEKLAVQLHHRLSGLDVPIGVDYDYGMGLPDD